MSWSILPSYRKPTNMVFLHMFFQCSAKVPRRDCLEKGWTWIYTDPRIAGNSMWAIQSTAQNMMPTKLPAALGGLFLLLKLPPPSNYLCSACAGKIQPSQGCRSAPCFVNERNRLKGMFYLCRSYCRSQCSPIPPLGESCSFAFRHVMQNSSVTYWNCCICC